ncbi:MAG: hypothetical protein KIT89_04375 [Microcella sp.]|uniref:hypothetical protein n=1 Tax=Microcella sp. TaxID=1913979 RepID=UPI0024CB92C4|nr:hypothetical protein [Microcella sp.]UYN84433.1 MAG: hypothetical protein KIT89_04375 [Microcella sp.]
MRIVLVHGRKQARKIPLNEKRAWIDMVEQGLRHNGYSVTINENDVRFAYYGNALESQARGLPESEVIVLNDGEVLSDETVVPPDEEEFAIAVLKDVADELGVDYRIALAPDAEFGELGFRNNPILRRLLQLLNEHAPTLGIASLFWATRDVYAYATDPEFQRRLDAAVATAMSADDSNIVVAHSLGSVVALSTLLAGESQHNWSVPLFLTLGSPLGVTAIHDRLRNRRYPRSVARWLNAFDERDVVSLTPLDDSDFPPGGIENHHQVQNTSDDHHGVAEYLQDPVVAKALFEALTNKAFGGSPSADNKL